MRRLDRAQVESISRAEKQRMSLEQIQALSRQLSHMLFQTGQRFESSMRSFDGRAERVQIGLAHLEHSMLLVTINNTIVERLPSKRGNT